MADFPTDAIAPKAVADDSKQPSLFDPKTEEDADLVRAAEALAWKSDEAAKTEAAYLKIRTPLTWRLPHFGHSRV